MSSSVLTVHPSIHPLGRLLLDLQVYVKENQFLHEFYEKPVASKFVIPYTSAHSKKMKMTVLVEEGLRRLRNTSRGMDWEVSRVVMTKWFHKLRRGGYPMTVRHQVIKSACDKFDVMCEQTCNKQFFLSILKIWDRIFGGKIT